MVSTASEWILSDVVGEEPNKISPAVKAALPGVLKATHQ